ncbi:hypothetical protein VTK73DRAFT_7529 [Phialemonium thermophilum]|uniref:Uncharacterized protein n=1 Tax=Phialemonium thermophilum TaxID=223376 RepID=A0ABR3WE48_9PEZI
MANLIVTFVHYAFPEWSLCVGAICKWNTKQHYKSTCTSNRLLCGDVQSETYGSRYAAVPERAGTNVITQPQSSQVSTYLIEDFLVPDLTVKPLYQVFDTQLIPRGFLSSAPRRSATTGLIAALRCLYHGPLFVHPNIFERKASVCPAVGFGAPLSTPGTVWVPREKETTHRNSRPSVCPPVATRGLKHTPRTIRSARPFPIPSQENGWPIGTICPFLQGEAPNRYQKFERTPNKGLQEKKVPSQTRKETITHTHIPPRAAPAWPDQTRSPPRRLRQARPLVEKAVALRSL